MIELKGELSSYKASVIAEKLGISIEEARELKLKGRLVTKELPKSDKPETKGGI